MNRVEPTVAVMKRAKSNRFRTFKFKNTARSELSGAYRMRSGDYCEVIHRPKFQIPADASVFTLGSCFAREVEAALLDRRFRLLGMSVDIPEELLALPQYRLANSSMLRAKGMHVPTVRSVVNQYTPASMAAEIASAFVEESDSMPPGLMTFANGLAYDFRHHGMKVGSLDLVTEARRSIDRANREIREADVLILTLGYTETWFMTDGGIPVNGTPLSELLYRVPDRFVFANANCPPSSPLRQNRGFAQGRILVSSQ